MKTKTIERIVQGIQFFLMFFCMTVGIWFILAFTWFCVGLPQTGGSLLGLAALSAILDWLYVKWITK